MNCKQVQHSAHAYIDRELSEFEQKQMKAHIQTCAECQTALQQSELLAQALKKLPLVRPPYSIVEQLMPALEQARMEKQAKLASPISRLKTIVQHRSTWRIASGVCAACIAVVLVIQQVNFPSTNLSDSKQTAFLAELPAVSDPSPSNMMKIKDSKLEGTDTNLDASSSDLTSATPVPDSSDPGKSIQMDQGIEKARQAAYPSPDGQYIGIIRNNQIEILDAKTQEVVYSTATKSSEADALSIIEWTKDGKLLYKVFLEGTSTLFQIDVAQQTEEQIDSNSNE